MTISHNEGAGVAGGQLRSLVENIERLESDKAEIAEDIKAAYAVAKSQGFDVAIIRKLIKDRQADAQKLRETRELYEIYARALGFNIFD